MLSDKIILFIGMPGSGKTYWAHELCDIVVDDIIDLNSLPLSLNGNVLGICDVNFCDPVVLNKAIQILRGIYGDIFIDLFYFENDSKKCRRNVAYRDDGRNVEGTIRRFEGTYSPPSNAAKIWVDTTTESV